MELIDRYVYAVMKRLPAGQRADIEKELRGLIEDMLTESSANPDAAIGATGSSASPDVAIEAVLKNLGHPALLAARYRGQEQHLIGPGLYFMYALVLKIVLLATGGGLLIAMVVNLVVDGGTDALKTIGETVGSLITGLTGAFGWVTLIFAAVERYSPEQIGKINDEVFDPQDLPQVPVKKDLIHPSDPIASMVFILIAMVAATYVPRFVGIFNAGELNNTMIPLFNESVYRLYLPFILGTLALDLIREIAKLITGRWTLPLSAFYLVAELPSLILTLIMMNDTGLFNDGFFTQLFIWMQRPDPMIWDLPMKLFVSRVIIGLACFGLFADTVQMIARMIRKTMGSAKFTRIIKN